jgi:hypothetical protein
MSSETGTDDPNTPPVVVPGVNRPEAPKKERKTPDPVSTLIGTWGESGKVFTVLTRIEAATDKQKTDAIKALPFGKYTVLTARETTKVYEQVVSARLS